MISPHFGGRRVARGSIWVCSMFVVWSIANEVSNYPLDADNRSIWATQRLSDLLRLPQFSTRRIWRHLSLNWYMRLLLLHCSPIGVTLSDIHSSLALLDWCENKKIRVKQSEVWTLSRVRPVDCILDAQRGLPLPLLHARWITDRGRHIVNSNLFRLLKSRWRRMTTWWKTKRIDWWTQDFLRMLGQ